MNAPSLFHLGGIDQLPVDSYLDIPANVSEDFTLSPFYKSSKYANRLLVRVAPGDALDEMDSTGARHLILTKSSDAVFNVYPASQRPCQWFTRGGTGELTYRIDVSSDYTTFITRDIDTPLIIMEKTSDDVIVSIQLPYIDQIPEYIDVQSLELHCFLYVTKVDGEFAPGIDVDYLDKEGGLTYSYSSPLLSFAPFPELASRSSPNFAPISQTVIQADTEFYFGMTLTETAHPNTFLSVTLTNVGLDYDISSITCNVEYSGTTLYVSPMKMEWELIASASSYYTLVITLYPEPLPSVITLNELHEMACTLLWAPNTDRAGFTSGVISPDGREMGLRMSSGHGQFASRINHRPSVTITPAPPQPTIIATRQTMQFRFRPNGNKHANTIIFPDNTTIQIIAYFQYDCDTLTQLCKSFPLILGNFVFINGIENYSIDAPTVVPFGRPERYAFTTTNRPWNVNTPVPSYSDSFIISTPDYLFIPDCVDPSTYEPATSGSRQCISGTCSLLTGTCSCTAPSAAVFFVDSSNPSCPQPTDPCPATACNSGPAIRDPEIGICRCDCQSDTVLPKDCSKSYGSKIRQMFPTSTFQQSGWDQRWAPSRPGPVLALNFGTFNHFFEAQYYQAEFLVVKLNAKISAIPDVSALFNGITDSAIPGIIGTIIRGSQQQSPFSPIDHEWQLNYSPQTGHHPALNKITLPFSQSATASTLDSFSFYEQQFGLSNEIGNHFIVPNPWYQFNPAQWTLGSDEFSEIRLHLFFDPSLANWGNNPTLSLARANALVQNLQVDLQFFGRDAMYYKKSVKTRSMYTYSAAQFEGFKNTVPFAFNVQTFQQEPPSYFAGEEFTSPKANGLTISFDFFLSTTPLPQNPFRLVTKPLAGALWRMGNFVCSVRPERENDALPFVQKPSTQSKLSAASLDSLFFTYAPWEEYGYPSNSKTLYSCTHDWHYKGEISEWRLLSAQDKLNLFLQQVVDPIPSHSLLYTFEANVQVEIMGNQLQLLDFNLVEPTPIVSNTLLKPNTEPGSIIYFAFDASRQFNTVYGGDNRVLIMCTEWLESYHLGFASRDGDDLLTLTVSTVTLPFLEQVDNFFAVPNPFTLQSWIKLRPMNIYKPKIFPSCAAVSFDQYGETQLSTTGICADNIECNLLGGFGGELCECIDTGSMGYGDLCDGKYVQEICSNGISCPNELNTFWVPDNTCTKCSCQQNVSCSIDQTFFPDLCSCICNSDCPNNNFDQDLSDCSCTCSLQSCPPGPTPVFNPTTCSCEPCSNECGENQTLDPTTCACKNDIPTCTPTNCEYNTQYDCQTASCNCDLNPFLVGSRCQTCSIRCNNNGLANNSCTQCNCSKDGITGQFCQCRSIRFTITFGSVPSFILDSFIANPIDTGSSEAALDYIRTQLLNQRGADLELFINLKIDTLTLTPPDPTAIGPKTLRITGNLRDNCATTLVDANYQEVSSKWSTFLNSLIKIVIDGEEIPVIDIEIALPDIKCDGILEPGCNEQNNSSKQSFILSSLVLLLILGITYSF